MLVPARRTVVLVFLAFALAGGAARAQDPQPTGSLEGRVVDSVTGEAAEGVTVTVTGPPAEPGGAPLRAVRTSGADGRFAFPSLPVGSYELAFEKQGRESSVSDVAVAAGQASQVELKLPPLPVAEPAPSDVEEFVVVASPTAEILAASRLDSDQLLNTLSAEDFSKLAISDVAEALKFVPGVNVVEGQFAIIRGLEDRYSSTLYNGAVVPSPDPDRQSIQLDLFPSDVVSDLAVSKTFGPELPSNSSGGSINILTQSYPEEFEFKLSGGSGFNDRAWDNFLEFVDGSAVGDETSGSDVLESDFAASLGGRGSLLEREIRFKAAIGWETDYETAEGYKETREPRRAATGQAGDLALGDLSLSGGRFDLTQSEEEERFTSYAGFGFDLDESGNHKIDASIFYITKEDETVEAKDDGFFPFFPYSVLGDTQAGGGEISTGQFDCCATPTTWIRGVRRQPIDTADRGPLWYTNFAESESFKRERDLFISQLNGDHHFDAIEGLHASWAGNYAKTTQDEDSRGIHYFYEPTNPEQVPTDFPTTPEDLGAGAFAANNDLFKSDNHISEDQGFGRLDLDYEIPFSDAFTLKLTTGGWYENASRDVDSGFLEQPFITTCTEPLVAGCGSQFAIIGADPLTLGKSIDGVINQTSGARDTTNESNREIQAWHLGSKGTLFEQLDLLAGFRLESIFIESLNDPFTGEAAFDGSPAIFPTKYLFFDRFDNPARGEPAPPPGTIFNDQILGIDLPIDPVTGLVDLVDRAQIEGLVNGEIDETKFLPSLGLTWRPLEGLALRAAWSETVARPSFREMGYYVSVEPGTDDLIVGNPQLGLSDVESYDVRAEYTWGDHGDLAALSLFYKTVQDPIESIVVRNPQNVEAGSGALFRTFFNNENEATVQGIEVEARKSLDFLGSDLAFLEYLSLGGNFTYIDAEVDRSEVEIIRAQPFFGSVGSLKGSRRLFSQPEWIANADISFDHPDWGTKATLVVFAISDVLDAAGSAFVTSSGDILSYTPDRYLDSYYQLDLIMSKTWRVDFLRGDLTFKVSIKNLTDSTRRIIYDPEQTHDEIVERSWKAGRDYSFSLTYEF